MQFLVLAYDYRDKDAMSRRMAVRQEHIATIDRYRKAGNMHIGAAILNEKNEMVGSAIVTEFPSREELDAWLKEEPYVTGKVWERIEVKPCQIGPSFLKKAS